MRGYKNRNNGFTLAEVLITLGIIGVVVAMTMPTLISKYKHKEYETRFKKAYSMLAQATYDLPIEYGRCDATNAQSINDYVFGKLKNINSGSFRLNGMSYKGNFKTYSLENTTSVIHPNCFDRASNQGSYNYIVTPDGITFSFCTNYTVGNSISVDINGINKGPNAFGHDLFFFRILMDDCRLSYWQSQWRDCTNEEKCDEYFQWTDGVCSKSSKAGDNGFACTSYAVANKCPDDSGKSYWDCLP